MILQCFLVFFGWILDEGIVCATHCMNQAVVVGLVAFDQAHHAIFDMTVLVSGC